MRFTHIPGYRMLPQPLFAFFDNSIPCCRMISTLVRAAGLTGREPTKSCNYKPISDAFYSDNFEGGVFSQVAAKLGNINIQIS